jgi:hypothetical protein
MFVLLCLSEAATAAAAATTEAAEAAEAETPMEAAIVICVCSSSGIYRSSTSSALR